MIRRLLFVPLLASFLIIIAAVVLPGMGAEASEIRQLAVFQNPNFAVSEETERPKQMDAKPKKVKLETLDLVLGTHHSDGFGMLSENMMNQKFKLRAALQSTLRATRLQLGCVLS